MPTPRLSDEAMREAYDLVKAHGSVMAASRVSGLPPATFEGRYKAALVRLALPPIHGPPGLNQRFEPPPPPPEPVFEKPRVRVRAGGAEMRVLAIGDLHMAPGMPTDHLGWIGQFAVDENPDHVVQIGDAGDWASCSAHDPNDTLKGRLKPSFTQDEEAVHAGHEALYGPMDRAGLKAERHQTDGNHEYRVDRFVNQHPELDGDWDIRVRQISARFNVNRREYGEWLFLGGVGFIHHPTNEAGRAYSGKTVANTVANDATFSIVWGHSHKQFCVTRPKIGPANNRVTILNLGTAMPPDYVPPYAQWSTTGWSYGVWLLSLAGGYITDHSFISMTELQRRYG